MVWFWIGLSAVGLVAFGTWRSRRARQIHGDRTVRSGGATYAPRDAMSASASAQTQAEVQRNRGDQQLMGF